MQIIDKSIDELIPYCNNSRTHDESQILQIASSIKEFGFTNPVLIDEDNGIIAGHGRVLAARKLGINKVPSIKLSHLTDIQKKAYIIADNKIALNAGWDEELLKNEIEQLIANDFDIDLIGFSDEEIDSLLGEKEEAKHGLTDEDYVPEVLDNAITRPGDIWILGNHRVMCGDSTNITDVSILTNKLSSIDICFTSPPYNASVVITDGKHDKKYLNNADNLSQNDYSDFLLSFFSNAQSVCQFVFVNIQALSNNKKALIDFLYKTKDSFADFIIWDKCSAEPAMAENVLNSQFEFVIVYSQKANRAIGVKKFRGNLSNVVSLSSRKDKEYSSVHKATFPVEFSDYFVNNFSNKTVFDPFSGTGTTLISCEKADKTCFCMELDPFYCDVIVKRWQLFTGEEAILESSGQTFNSYIK